MSLITSSLLRFPSGPLSPQMYRGATLQEFDAALTQYVSAASSKVMEKVGSSQYEDAIGTTRERYKEAELAYALHLAYTQLAVLAATLPTQANEVNVSASYSNSPSALRNLAKDQLEAFNNALVIPAVEQSDYEYSESNDAIAEF